MNKVYRGKRLEKGNVKVTVNNIPLEPIDGYCFDWGNMSDGSYHLAYRILEDYLRDVIRALKYSQMFQERVISIISTKTWTIGYQAIEYELGVIKKSLREEMEDFVLERNG